MGPVIFIAAMIITFIAAIIGGMVGGSYLILIPALLFLGIDIHHVIGITKITSIALGLAFINYLRNGKVNIRSSWPYALPVVIGSIIGSFIVIGLDKVILQKIIAVFIIAIGVFLLFRKDFGVNKLKRKIKKSYIVLAVILFFILGIYEGFYAAASSIFIVMIFSGLLGKDFVESIGDTRFIELFAAIAATVIFASEGLIDYKIAIPIGIVYFFGGWVGSQITIKKGAAWIRYVIIIIAFAFGVKMLFF
ncbi:sulfite exporter TauE/SafE family protein [Candidatus Woesearchaeota archaeon]|nr:sulfite exporter TauE/SafE family protein [Candidatus Woesearchaeota archaeon]